MSKTNNLNNQRGVALIMVLSILALLMVTIVGFVFSAKTESLAARNQENDRMARGFADNHFAWLQSIVETKFGATLILFKESQALERRIINLAMIHPDLADDYKLRYDFPVYNVCGPLSGGRSDGMGMMEVDLKNDPSPVMYSLGFQATVDANTIKGYTKFRAQSSFGERPMGWHPAYSRENQRENPDEEPELVARYTYLDIQEDIKFDINGLAKMRGKMDGSTSAPLAYSELYSDAWIDRLTGSGISDPNVVKEMIDKRPSMRTASGDQIAVPWNSWKQIWRSNLFCRDHSRASISEEEDAREVYNMFTPHSMPNGEWFRYLGATNDVREMTYLHRYYIGNILDVDDNDLKSKEVKLFTTDADKSSILSPFFAQSGSVDPESAMFMQAYNRGAGTPVDQDKASEVWLNKETVAIPHLGFIKGQCDNIGRGTDGSFNGLKNDGKQNLDGYGSVVSDISRQVAANLLDYNDANSEPTMDYAGKATDYLDNEERIKFCGLEETPYIAQVRPIINFTAGSGASTVRIASIQAAVVLADLYGGGPSVSIRVTIPSVTIDGDNFSNPGSSPASGGMTFTGGYSAVKVVNCTSNQIGNDVTTAAATEIIIPVMVVEVLDGGKVVDVSLIRNIGMGYSIDTTTVNQVGPGIQPSPTGTDGVGLVVSFRDPRCNNYVDCRKTNTAKMANFGTVTDYEKKWCNLYIDTFADPVDTANKVPENWTAYTSSIYPVAFFLKSNDTGYIKPGAYTAEIDKEGNPVRPSTAKIRNEQMTSLWELGCIHRGEPWRTINLKGYARRDGSKIIFPVGWRRQWQQTSTKISGLYSDGDADLLDQIKMTTEAFTYPQVSIGNPNPDYWTMIARLFKSIATVENDYMLDKGGNGKGRKYYHWPSQMDNNFLESFFTRKGSNSTSAVQFFIGDSLYGRNGVPFLFVNLNNSSFGSGGTGILSRWFWRNYNSNHQGLFGPVLDNASFRGYVPVEVGSTFTSRKDDFYQEEPIGKVSDLIKMRSNIFRSIVSVQLLAKIPKMQARLIEKIYDNNEEDPRVVNYVNIHSWPGENGVPNYRWESELEHHWAWYRVVGQQKMMFMLQRNPEAHVFEAKSKEVLENDY